MASKRPTQLLPPFDVVIDEHGPKVLRFCYARVPADYAEDCFQETMLAALRGYNDLHNAEAPLSWLFTIASRKCMDFNQKQSLETTKKDNLKNFSQVVESPTTAAPSPDQTDIWERVRTLPQKQQEAVTLKYMADLNYKEIGQVMQTTSEAARRSVFEGLQTLRKSIAQQPL